jgi:hypothetical protein
MNSTYSGPKSMLTSAGRSRTEVLIPAFWVATHHSPIEIAIVTPSLVRARSPSDRRRTIFV